MKLGKAELAQYSDEITDLYAQELNESASGLIHFGIFSGTILHAIASLKCYSGHWYLRGCVVKPEFRGRGMQRQLIQERLEYLSSKTDQVRVSVFPDNLHSIRNIEETGFEFEKIKKLANGEEVLVYKKILDD